MKDAAAFCHPSRRDIRLRPQAAAGRRQRRCAGVRWRFVLLHRVQQLTQLDRLLIAPASATAADIDEPIFFQGRQQEPTDRWLMDDDKTVAAPAGDLQPPAAATAVTGLFPVLGDYSFKTMLAGRARCRLLRPLPTTL